MFSNKPHRIIALILVLTVFLGCQRVIPINAETSVTSAGDKQPDTLVSDAISSSYSSGDMASSPENVAAVTGESAAAFSNGSQTDSVAEDIQQDTTDISSSDNEEPQKESLFEFAFRKFKGFVKKNGEELLLTEKVNSSNATIVSDSSIKVEWTPVNDAEGYEITWIHGTDTSYYETTNTSYTFENLPIATSYSYTIRYYKTLLGQKLFSEPSQVFYAYTPAGKVTNLTVTNRSATSASSAAVTLSWDAMNDANYNIYYRNASSEEFALSGKSETNTYTVPNLEEATDYVFYVQAFCGDETNVGEPSDSLTATTCPAPVTNAKVKKETENSASFSWDANPNCNTYYIYRCYDDAEHAEFTYYTTVTDVTSFTDTNLIAGMKYNYYIFPYLERADLLASDSPLVEAITNPTVSKGLAVTGNTSSTLSLTWEENGSATGYMIYRKEGTGTYTYIGVVNTNSFTDTNLKYARIYQYKIRSYAYTVDHYSGYSTITKTCTLPKTVELKVKGGNKKVRLTWKKQSRIIGYNVYCSKSNAAYKLVDTITDVKTVSKIYTGLTNKKSYKYKVIAYRTAFEQTFNSEPAEASAKVAAPGKTKQTPAYYKNNKALKNSPAWKNYEIVKKYADLKKSYTIPGVNYTNVAGFGSTQMCPQGLTFAGKYLLISSYDANFEENSVIYVMNKSTRKLATVLVLPTQSHVGGICYDGKRVWVANGKNISAIPYSTINAAAKAKSAYKVISAWDKTVALTHSAAFVTYYKKQFWIGVFSYTNSSKLYSYSMTISGNKVTLKNKSTVTIPSAVQGITFGTGGKLIMSRAYAKTHKLELYKPKKTGTAKMTLGKPYKSVSVPYLSEEIAVLGKYLYINFESGIPGNQAPDHMDRVLAVKLSAVQKENKKKK